MDKFVSEYLKAQGCTEVLHQFEEAMKKKAEEPAQHGVPKPQLPSPFGEIADVIHTLFKSENRESINIDHFSEFRSWVHSSLDVVKPELLALLFPLFVKSYITSIMEKQYEIANRLFQLSSGDFMCDYGNEMRSLAQLTDIEQLNSSIFLSFNPFIKHASSRKFKMRISSVAFDLLKNYLIQNKMYSLVEVINKRIQFDIQDMAFANSDCIALLEGHNFSRDKGFPGVVEFGVPGEGPYNIEGIDAKSVIPDTNTSYFKNLIEQIVLPQMVRRGDKEDGGDEGGDSGSSVLEPSIAFVTVTDAVDSMICLHLSKNAKQAVAGFSDSRVRVWSHYDDVCSPKVPPEELEEEGVAGYKRMRGCGVMDEVLPRAGGSTSASTKLEEDTSESDGTCFPKVLELIGHSQRVYSVSQDDYSSDGRLVLSASADETVRLWDTHYGQCVGKNISSEGIPWTVSMSPLGYYYVTGNQLGTCSLFSVDSWKTLRVFRGHSTDVTSCAWHPNMAYVVTGSGDRSVRMWDVRTADCVRHFSPQLARSELSGCVQPTGAPSAMSMSHLAEVTSLACSPCGSIIAAGYENGAVALWDVPAGKLSALLSSSETENVKHGGKKSKKATTRSISSNLGAVTGMGSPVYSLGFSADGTGLVTGGSTGVVNVWNIAPASRWSNAAGATPSSPLFISPHKSFYTKQTPVYSVGYGTNNVVIAGGAFTVKQY